MEDFWKVKGASPS